MTRPGVVHHEYTDAPLEPQVLFSIIVFFITENEFWGFRRLTQPSYTDKKEHKIVYKEI